VSEAVLLSDRVIVLSPRPAEIVADIAIDLPRPASGGRGPERRGRALIDQVFAALAKGMAVRQPAAGRAMIRGCRCRIPRRRRTGGGLRAGPWACC
jgi:NitT/TauT family transport system ATP-binding protein